MGKKRLDTVAIENELGRSAFFQPPQQAPAPVEIDPPAARPYERTPVTPPAPLPARPPVRARTITRYAFEFYQDQIDALKHHSLAQKQRGEKGSMSEMVREALDAYLATRGDVE